MNFIYYMELKKGDNYQNINNNKNIPGSKDFIELNGEIIELLPSTMFKIKTENGQEILGHLSGKMRMNKIKILPGDKVKLQISPYDLTKGRIIYRY